MFIIIMANTYTQLYLQLVFAVKGRQSLLPRCRRDDVFRFITGVVQHPSRKHKLIAINGMSDHVHLLVGLHPAMDISSLVRDIKSNSSHFINDNQMVRGEFHWQTGYGAFSYSHSEFPSVARYIRDQEEHHRVRTFREEYLKLLEEFSIEYDTQYLFEWIEDAESLCPS